MLKEMIERTMDEEDATRKISTGLTQYMENKYQGAWVCVIGKKFTANIMHEPGFFLRASNENYHILVIKLKVPTKKETGKVLKKPGLKSNIMAE
jgi:hypothetical protein